MFVKNLKEILRSLPDDMEIVSGYKEINGIATHVRPDGISLVYGKEVPLYLGEPENRLIRVTDFSPALEVSNDPNKILPTLYLFIELFRK